MIELGDGNATFEWLSPSCTIVSAILIATGPGFTTGAEVVPAEEAAAELDDHRCVLGPGELVVEPDAAGLRERH